MGILINAVLHKMKTLPFLCILLLVTLAQGASAGISGYFTSYCLHRDFAARHAPAAITRHPLAWLRSKPVTIEIKHGRIMWMRFAPKTAIAKIEREVLEPIFYYFFMPLVEIDCALNMHPFCPDHYWRFFGPNAEFEPRPNRN